MYVQDGLAKMPLNGSTGHTSLYTTEVFGGISDKNTLITASIQNHTDASTTIVMTIMTHFIYKLQSMQRTRKQSQAKQ